MIYDPRMTPHFGDGGWTHFHLYWLLRQKEFLTWIQGKY